MIIPEQDARKVCEKLLGHVTADDATVSVNSEDYAHLRFSANSFATSGRRENQAVSVAVWVEKRRGSASTNELDDESLKAVVAEAEQIARVSPVDREYLPTLGAQQYKRVEGYSEATASISLEGRAKAIDGVISACEKESVIGAGFHQARGTGGATATRNGNFNYGRASLVSLGMTARTRAGDGSGYFLRNHYDVNKLDTGRVAREAVQKALRSREPRAMDPGTYTVVFEPQAMADLLSSLPVAFDARSADEGRSAFSAAGGKTRVGERIFDERISCYTDPWNAELPGSHAAQGGLPAQKFYLVRDGVLETLVYSRYWAQQKSKEPSPGPVNSILESKSPGVSIEDMIKDTKKGLLVGRFWYLRGVDPRTISLTGLTRDGVWYIENGQIQFAVRNFRFNQSILRMLAPGNVDLIGAPERVGNSESQGGNSALLPAMKVKEFQFTSQSEAV